MQTKIDNKDASHATLAVDVPKEELLVFIQRVEQTALSEVQIDGFRKGKAPSEVGKQHVDTVELLRVALEQALEKTLADALSEQGLDVFKVANLKISENSAEHLAYTVDLTLFPNVTLPDLASIAVARRDVAVTDKEIDDTLEIIRGSRATFTSKDEPATEGDRVEVDFEVRMGGNLIEGGESKNHPLIIGGKNFIPGFEDNLVGMKKLEEKLFSLVAPEDYFQKNIAGKKLDFKVTVKEVQTVHKPDLSDTFAQGLGKFQNVDQLKGGIREGIYEEKRQKEKQRLRLEILDNLIQKTSFVLPDELIEDQLASMLVGFERDLAQRGMDINMYLAHLEKTRDDLKKEWRLEAERQAKIAFLIHRVAKEKSITPSEEEITLALNEMVQEAVTRGNADSSQIDVERARHTIMEQLTNEKTLNFIEGVCGK